MGILDAPAFAPTATNRDKVDSAASIALQSWFAGLANRDNAPAKILCLGDSVTEGSSATSIANRWVARLRDQMRLRHQTAGLGSGGGTNFLPPYFDGTSMGNPWASKVGNPGKDTGFGFGRRAAVMGSTDSYTYTITGTSFDVCYASGTTTGTLTVQVDGGTVQTIATAGSIAGGKRWNSGALSAGSHTVVIGCTGNNSYFTGLMIYNGDEAKGLQVVEGGHFGWKTTDWVGNQNFYAADITAYAPHVITLALGLNDYQAGVASATVRTNLESIISRIRTALTVKPSFVLIPWHLRGDVASPVEPWSNYVAAMYAIAAADTGGVNGASGVAVFDASRRLPAPGSAGAGDPFTLINTDRVHPTNKGHAVIADALTGFLSPR